MSAVGVLADGLYIHLVELHVAVQLAVAGLFQELIFCADIELTEGIFRRVDHVHISGIYIHRENVDLAQLADICGNGGIAVYGDFSGVCQNTAVIIGNNAVDVLNAVGRLFNRGFGADGVGGNGNVYPDLRVVQNGRGKIGGGAVKGFGRAVGEPQRDRAYPAVGKALLKVGGQVEGNVLRLSGLVQPQVYRSIAICSKMVCAVRRNVIFRPLSGVVPRTILYGFKSVSVVRNDREIKAFSRGNKVVCVYAGAVQFHGLAVILGGYGVVIRCGHVITALVIEADLVGRYHAADGDCEIFPFIRAVFLLIIDGADRQSYGTVCRIRNICYKERPAVSVFNQTEDIIDLLARERRGAV